MSCYTLKPLPQTQRFNIVRITIVGDVNDADYVSKTVTFTKKEFIEPFNAEWAEEYNEELYSIADVVRLIYLCSKERHGYESFFGYSKPDTRSALAKAAGTDDLLCELIPDCPYDGREIHSVKSIEATYFDESGTAWEIEFND